MLTAASFFKADFSRSRKDKSRIICHNFAGLGVAMGNASNHVKNLADYVTDSNEENGVATAIAKFILGH